MFLTKINRSHFYQLVYFIDGKRKTLSTKTSNVKEAKLFLANFTPPDNKKNITTPVDVYTLSKFRNEYINYAKIQLSKDYVKGAIEPSLNLLIKYAGDIPLNELDIKILDNFISEKYSSSKFTAALYYRTLKSALSKAVIWNYILDNPLKKIKAPRVTKSLPLFIIEDDLNLILGNTKSEQLKNIFTVGFYSGMRLGEILNMRFSWIDYSQDIIVVKNSDSFTTKSKKERIIPIHPRIKSILVNKNLNDDYIFTNKTGIKFNNNFVSKQFKISLRASKLNDNIHFHTLRHSFASNLVQRGVNLYVVKELLGHQDIKTTQIYSHLQKQNLATAICLL